jgi:hypothetical protein
MLNRFHQEFLRELQPRSRAGEPGWHRTVRALYVVTFIVVWLEAVGCFVYFQILARGGSPVATSELAASVVNHGHAFYVAVRQKQLYELLLTMMKIRIPGTIITGLLLHYLIGVKIVANR